MLDKDPNFDFLNLFQGRPDPPLCNDLISSIYPILTEQTDYSPNPYKTLLFKKKQTIYYDIIHNAETSINEEAYISNNKSTMLGRKKNNDNRESSHNKFSSDNIINKVKTHIFNKYIISLIEKNSLDKNDPVILKKVPTKFNEKLKKDEKKTS